MEQLPFSEHCVESSELRVRSWISPTAEDEYMQ